MKSLPIPVTILAPTLLFAAFGLWQLNAAPMSDLFIYRAGAVVGWDGVSPYSQVIPNLVQRQYPDNDELYWNCGFFLPPMAIVAFGPLAAVPWATAKLLYLVLVLVSVTVCWYGSLSAFRNQSLPRLNAVPALLPACVLLHILTVFTFLAGQTTLLATGAVIAGQLLFQSKRSWLGAFLWSLAFVKPHVALPLLPLAFLLHGWKSGTRLLIWLAVSNALGCILASGSPSLAFEYLDYLKSHHKGVIYNRVADNPQIVSWNAVWFNLTDHAIDLTMKETLIGMAVAAGLIAGRIALFKARPSPAWLVAASITCGLLSCQVMGYELFLLALVVPHFLNLVEQKRKWDVAVLGILFLLQSMPLPLMHQLGWDRYRAWLLLMMAAALLARPR